ncbi:type III secretion system export apparatus subunit SctT [Trinickia acidisoli]|uniref:type III secretion system export apparatus subunit SctT n=1 Tax=Trinickia acidisoli TaxID=2767482 RepID=UPI001A8CC3E2|nr:type III secretion system export apparatus subunit SctT [Trinickia acidisoli]
MNLLDALPQISHWIEGYLVATGLCSLRLYVTFFVFPPTSDTVMQGVVRNALVILFSSFVTYGQPVSFIESLRGALLIEVGLREALIGLVIGFAASVVFWVAEAAGTYMDDLTGYNNVQITNPLRPETSTFISTLLGQIAITAFWALGGMTLLLEAVYESYQWWPLSAHAPNMSNIIEAFTMRQTDSLMQSVAKLAAPMVLLLVLVDIAFGFASRAAPKLELMALGQPVKGALAALMLALFVGLFVDQVTDQVTLRDFSVNMHELASPDLDGATDKSDQTRTNDASKSTPALR